jgi:transcriptional regulator with XRE-family HTH domain
MAVVRQEMQQQESRQMKLTLGANLRAAREAVHMTQRQVGEAVGATGSDVSRWETGRIEPGAMYRVALANLLFDGDVSALYRPLSSKAAA